MLKRLLLGLFKGLVIGGGIAAAFHFGLHWTEMHGLLGYLLAMGVAGTSGVLTGKPPWKHAAWIEALLKGVAGAGVGALLYWLGDSYASFEVPFAAWGIPANTPWTHAPLLFAPAIAGVFGAMVELDNTGDDEEDEKTKKPVKKAAPKSRVAGLDDEEEEVPVRKGGARAKR